MHRQEVLFWVLMSPCLIIFAFCAFGVLYRLFQLVAWCFKKYSSMQKVPMMRFKAFCAYHRNAKYFLVIFSSLIEKYEKEGQNNWFSFAPSCKKEMVKLMKQRLSLGRSEVSKWKSYNIDYIKVAHAHLSSVSFDLLASGSFHVGYGELNPMSSARNLLLIHNKAIKWALDNGYITSADALEDSRALRQSISEVG